MNFADILRSAVANTFRSKVRTALTVVAIFIGAFTLTLTTAIGNGVSGYIDKQMESIGGQDTLTVGATITEPVGDGPEAYDPETLTGTGGLTLLSNSDLDAIRATDGVQDVEPAVMLTPDYIEWEGNGKFQLSVAPMAGSAEADLAAGSQLDADASEPQILLPVSYVETLGFDAVSAAPGQKVAIGVTDYLGVQHEVLATVAGVQNDSLFAAGAGLNAELRAQISSLQSNGLPAGTETGYMMAFSTITAGATEEQVDAIKADLAGQGYTALTVADQIGAIQTVIDGIIMVLNSFAVIALIAAAFGIVNTLLMSVQERTREIGLMKAMGMGAGRIFALFSVEAVFIGFLGSALGAGVAIGLGSVISSVLSETVLSALPGLQIMLFTPNAVAMIIGVVMVIAFLAGTLPARRAAKQHPIDALRYE